MDSQPPVAVRRTTERVCPPLRDAALAGATFVAVLAGTVIAGGEVSWAGEWSLATLLSSAVFLRRRWPIWVLAGSCAAIAGFGGAGLTETGWVWPATVAYATAVLAGELRWAVAIGLVQLSWSAAWVWVSTDAGVAGPLSGLGVEALWLALVLAGANAYCNWLGWQDEVAARLAQQARERDIDARRRQAEERIQIAREIHDVVAHTLAVAGVQLNVAADGLDESSAQVREALQLAQRVHREARADLASLVGVLRSGDAPQTRRPHCDLSDLTRLLDSHRAAGLDTTLEVDENLADLPAAVRLAIYRVAQEALTNVLKHANASSVRVAVCGPADQVTVDVRDDGRSAGTTPPDMAPGHGIAGMRARVAALGGTLEAGPDQAGGGFAVRATIPAAVADSVR